MILLQWTRTCYRRSLQTLPHVAEEITHPGKSLLPAGKNLAGWQHETAVACISEFGCEGVITGNYIIDIVYTTACNLVNGIANRPVPEPSAVHGGNGCGGTLQERLEFSVFWRQGGA